LMLSRGAHRHHWNVDQLHFRLSRAKCRPLPTRAAA
jgi:hypothetical protein